MKMIMRIIDRGLEKHPILTLLVMSLLLMAVVDSEILSSFVWLGWAAVGMVKFFMWMAKEGFDL